MSVRVVVAALVAVTVTAEASDNSVEVTLEDTPPENPPHHWKFLPFSPPAPDSDSQGDQWRDKFITASDKRLGTAKDTSAIEALVPSSIPLMIRWISRSVALVSAGCYSDAHSELRLRCLYVFAEAWLEMGDYPSLSAYRAFDIRSNHSMKRIATD